MNALYAYIGIELVGFDFLRNLGVVLIFMQIGVTVGEAENPRRNVPKGPPGMIFPWVPTHQGPQPYGGVCQVDRVRNQAIDTSSYSLLPNLSLLCRVYIF